MKLRIIESFDGSFTIEREAEEKLFEMLRSSTFLEQISDKIQGQKVKFTEIIFQPVPYSKETPKGMPAEFEKYHHSDDYVIVNVPPNFTFKAKIFKPSRLCAIYRKVS